MLDLNALPLPQLFETLCRARGGGDLERVLKSALAEDLNEGGDVTSASIIDPARSAVADVVMRKPGIVCGLAIGPTLLERRQGRFDALARDGSAVEGGQPVARLEGNLRFLLAIERTLLNLVGRLSGIATLTRRYVDAIAGTKAVICDTRKTTPGLRSLEKYAVRCGGGTLHRLGLYDAALYKDNHLAGIPLHELRATLTAAIRHARHGHALRFVEVEVDSLDQLREVLAIEPSRKGGEGGHGKPVDIILLDNMIPPTLREAVKMRNAKAPKIQLEASGGVTLETVRAIAETGVDRISVGAITHSAPALDVGLDIRNG